MKCVMPQQQARDNEVGQGREMHTSMNRWRQSESLVEYSVTVGRPPGGAVAARFLLDSRDTRRVSPRPMLYCDRFRSDSSSCAAQQFGK